MNEGTIPRIGAAPPEDSALIKRIKAALVADMTANRLPPPKSLPAFAIAHDPQTGLFRIGHARQFDVAVEIVYVRACDLKGQIIRVMQAEIMVEAQLSDAYGRAMLGLDPVTFDD